MRIREYLEKELDDATKMYNKAIDENWSEEAIERIKLLIVRSKMIIALTFRNRYDERWNDIDL